MGFCSDIDASWNKPDSLPGLKENQVVVWRFNPRSQYCYINRFESLLSQEEKQRLARFVDQEARRNFVVCRGVLRFLLAQVIKTTSRSLNIQNGRQGKPNLDPHAHSFPVKFNISHTQGLCVISISKNLEVGVDVEKIHSMDELARMAHSYLTLDEYELWENTEESLRIEKFYEYWCAKEAILKAAGYGLSIHPGQINILDAVSNQPIRGTQEDGFLFEIRDYQLIQLPLEKEFKGWLAVLGKPDAIVLNDFFDQVMLESEFSFPDGMNVEK